MKTKNIMEASSAPANASPANVKGRQAMIARLACLETVEDLKKNWKYIYSDAGVRTARDMWQHRFSYNRSVYNTEA